MRSATEVWSDASGVSAFFSANRVETDIGHGSEDRLFIQQRPGLEAAFPETPGHFVFGIGIGLANCCFWV